MKKIAVILAGCGRLDGSEIHESVLTLLSIQQAGAGYQCFSLNLEQDHVTNHLTNKTYNDKRNMLTESARIARGDILDLTTINIEEYDGLIIPGGDGIAANLFTFAQNGAEYSVNETVATVARKFTEAKKPVGFICIAPVMIPAIYDFPVNMTIGNNPDIADIITKRGAIHNNCMVNEICVDNEHKIISTPAYMLANSILSAYTGISRLCLEVVKLS